MFEGRFMNATRHMCPSFLGDCVLAVYYENIRRDEAGTSEFKAAADVWFKNSAMKKQVKSRAAAVWSKRTGKHAIHFPWSKSCVGEMYCKIRKRASGEVDGFDAEVKQVCQKLIPVDGGDVGPDVRLFD